MGRQRIENEKRGVCVRERERKWEDINEKFADAKHMATEFWKLLRALKTALVSASQIDESSGKREFVIALMNNYKVLDIIIICMYGYPYLIQKFATLQSK